MFGIIDGTSVGDLYAYREELASAGIHAPLMAGIWGAQEGAIQLCFLEVMKTTSTV